MTKEKSPKTKIKDRAVTENKLLSTSEQVFSKLGFKGATTRLIAKKADINLSLINRYFKGKYGLFLALVDKKAKTLTSIDLPYPPQDNPQDELIKYADVVLTEYVKEMNFIKIVFVQFFSDEKFLKKFRNQLKVISRAPQLEARLRLLIDNGKMTRSYKLERIIKEIETQAFGYLLIEIVIYGREVEEVRRELKEFVLRTSTSLVP